MYRYELEEHQHRAEQEERGRLRQDAEERIAAYKAARDS